MVGLYFTKPQRGATPLRLHSAQRGEGAGEDKAVKTCKSSLTVVAARGVPRPPSVKEISGLKIFRLPIASRQSPDVAASARSFNQCQEGAGVMSTEIRQDPWGVMPGLQNEINRLFGNARESESSSATAMWVPLVDIHEYPDRFELYIDLPGVNPSTVDLTLEGGILTVSGERQRQARNAGEETQGRRIERGHGRFHRRFVLPDTVDSEKVNAAGRHGVLAITIPKLPKATPRKIQIAP
jgi:HSP20 family protein